MIKKDYMMNKDDIKKLDDSTLMMELLEAYGVSNVTKLCDEIDMSFSTMSKWDTVNGIPTNIPKKGNTRQYLELLLYCQLKENLENQTNNETQEKSTIKAYEYKTYELYDKRIEEWKSDSPEDIATDLLSELGIEFYQIEEVEMNPFDNSTPHLVVKITIEISV